jgi:hypothetical protein
VAVDPDTPGPEATDPGTTDPATTEPGADPATATNPPAARRANAVPPSIPPQTVGVSASGVARVRIVCPQDSGGCSGTVVIELPSAAAARSANPSRATAAARRRALVRVGRARFTAKAGSSPTVPVVLSKRGRQRILRGGRSRARVTVTARSANGKSVVTTQDVTIRPRASAAGRTGRKADRR